MNNENNNLDEIPEFFYNVTLNFLNILKAHFDTMNYESLLLEKGTQVGSDTLVVNLGTAISPLAISFTFVPIPAKEIGIDTVFLQIYSLMPSKPQVNTMPELEKSLHFLNNQLLVGHLGLSNGNEITLRTIQALPTNNYDLDVAPFDRILDLFQMAISIFTPYIDDVCRGKKTFKQIAFELSN